MEQQNGSVVVKIEKNLAIITFGHPRSNAMPSELLGLLSSKITEISQMDEISVILLQTFGDGVFCAGASFDELLMIDNQEQGNKFFSSFAHVLIALQECQKLTVARVQGKAVGGGVGILAACDFVLATSDSAVKLSELEIGIGPFVIEPAISRKIGKTTTAALTLQASKWHSAEWALLKGLYSQVFPNIEKMDQELSFLINKWCSYNPESLMALKKIFWEDCPSWNPLMLQRASISGKLVLSDFTKNALLAFKNK